MLVDDIHVDKRGVLAFDEEAITEYIGILQQASSQDDLTARDIYQSLVIPADDILRLLKQLWQVEANRSSIIKLCPLLMPLLEVCLNKGQNINLVASLDLLWTLITNSDLLAGTAEMDTLVAVLVGMFIDETTEEQIRSMARCIFYKLNPDQLGNAYNNFTNCI